jgi:4,5-DOPA dioxygenase extradiol
MDQDGQGPWAALAVEAACQAYALSQFYSTSRQLAALADQIAGLRDQARKAHEEIMCNGEPEHFLPLLYVAGLAAAVKQSTKVLVDGYTYGSLSMTSYTLDVDCPRDHEDAGPAAGLPDPKATPPEDTNV